MTSRWREARLKRLSPEELLEWWGHSEPPIPAVPLARWLGLTVRRKTLNQEGFLNLDLPEPTLFLNPENSPMRQRFTIAHEIGHLCLHPERQELLGCKEEEEADNFARLLLVPTVPLSWDMYKLGAFRISDEVIEYLSGRYLVSRRVIEIRITDVLKFR